MATVKKINLKRVLIILLIVIFAFCAGSMAATKIIYDSIFVRYDAAPVEVPETLSDMVSGREARDFMSGDNRLTGYLYRCDADTANGDLVLIAPGFHAGADNFLWQVRSFLDHGWSVFVFDATGHCSSQGKSAVGFPQLLKDVEAALMHIENHDRFGYNNIVLFGHSQGGYASACALAGDFDVTAVVSVSGINSAMDGIIGKATEYVGPVAYGNYGFLWLYQVMVFGGDIATRNAVDAINESGVPVLIVHGSGDTTVPMDRFSIISHADRLDPEQVEIFICDEPQQDGHTNLLFDTDGTANDELMERVNEFFARNTQ